MDNQQVLELTEQLDQMAPDGVRVGFRNTPGMNGSMISSILVTKGKWTAEMALGDNDTDPKQVYEAICEPAIAYLESRENK